jgi:hypothetical protein
MARESGGFWIYVWIWGLELFVFGAGGGWMAAMLDAAGSDIPNFVCSDTNGGDDAAANG